MTGRPEMSGIDAAGEQMSVGVVVPFALVQTAAAAEDQIGPLEQLTFQQHQLR